MKTIINRIRGTSEECYNWRTLLYEIVEDPCLAHPDISVLTPIDSNRVRADYDLFCEARTLWRENRIDIPFPEFLNKVHPDGIS